MQPRVPAELAQPGHRASDLRLPLIESKKADEIEARAAHTRRMHALKFFVRNPVVDDADAAIMIPIVQAFERVQQQAMIAAVNRAVHDDAAIEADCLVHPLRFAECRAGDRRVGRIGPRWKHRRVLIEVKLTIAASPRRRRNRHPRLFIPFVNFLSGCRHCDSPVISRTPDVERFYIRRTSFSNLNHPPKHGVYVCQVA